MNFYCTPGKIFILLTTNQLNPTIFASIKNIFPNAGIIYC